MKKKFQRAIQKKKIVKIMLEEKKMCFEIEEK